MGAGGEATPTAGAEEESIATAIPVAEEHTEVSGPNGGLDATSPAGGTAQMEPSLLYKIAVVCAAFVAAVLLLNSMKLIYEQPDHFRYPLLITAFHQLMVMSFADVFLRVVQSRASPALQGSRRQHREFGRMNTVQSLKATADATLQASHWPRKKGLLRKRHSMIAYWSRIVAILHVVGPVAFFGATCVACANTALLHIYPSLHEMIQNLGPLWVILVGRVVRPERRHNMWTYASLVPIFIGGALCISGEVGSFSMLGIAFSNLTALSRSLRLVAQERVFETTQVVASTAPRASQAGLHKPVVLGNEQEWDDEEEHEETQSMVKAASKPSAPGQGGAAGPECSAGCREDGSALNVEDIRSMDSLTLLYYTAPFNFLLFLLYSITYEDLFGLRSGQPFMDGKVYKFFTFRLGSSTYMYFMLTGVIASVFNLLAFMQVELVGGFASTMISCFKTPAAIIASWWIFGNRCTSQQLLGVLLVGAGLQVYNKYGKTTTA